MFKPILTTQRREGRITPAQKKAFEILMPKYSDFKPIFDQNHPCILEIGFGMGQSLVDQAIAHPDVYFLGVELYRPGIGAILQSIEKYAIKNLCVYYGEALAFLEQYVPNESLIAIQIFFPDPWPKRRHHKRRMMQPDFIKLTRMKLKKEGCLYLATDWQDYAEHMMKVMSEAEGFENLAGKGNFSARCPFRSETKFELRGKKLGYQVWDLAFRKI